MKEIKFNYRCLLCGLPLRRDIIPISNREIFRSYDGHINTSRCPDGKEHIPENTVRRMDGVV